MSSRAYINPYALVGITEGQWYAQWDQLKFALLTSAYSPMFASYGGSFIATDNIWSNVSAHEVAAGAGYTAGGCEVFATGIPYDDPTYSITSNGVSALYCTSPRWSALTKTFRYGVLYSQSTRNGIVKPLILTVQFTSPVADVTVTASDFMFRWPSNGFLRLR